MRPVGRMVLEPQPGQLLRRDRAGRVLHGAHRPGHRLQQRPAAAGPHPLVRRHADHAARRAELPRDPDQRAGRAGAQQPARRHASPGDPARPRRLRAELARRRLPVPGRHARLRLVPAAGDGRQGARQAREVRRPLHAGARCSASSQTPSREEAHRRRVPLRADQGRRRRRSASAWSRCSPTSTASSRSGVADGLGIAVPAAAAARARDAGRRPR